MGMMRSGCAAASSAVQSLQPLISSSVGLWGMPVNRPWGSGY